MRRTVKREVWLRHPFYYLRDALANGYTKFVFDREVVGARKMDVVSYMREKCIGVNSNVEYMLVGPQGAALYDTLSVHKQPRAVYPVWTPAEPITALEDLMENPVGDRDSSLYAHLPEGLRPVPGQKHVVVVRELPRANSGIGHKIMRDIQNSAELFDDCTLHLNDEQNYSYFFDYGFHSIDFSPIGYAENIKDMSIYLPHGVFLGMNLRPEWAAYEDWINYLGFQLRQITTDKRVLTAFNIRSIHWAAEWYSSDLKFDFKFKPTLDQANVPKVYYKPKANVRRQSRNKMGTAARAALLKDRDKNSDFALCNGCIYRVTCKLARVNSVCIYKGADTLALADAFGSRNADRIIDGLSGLIKMQADRTERAVEDEAINGDRDPEVTRQINALFKNGVLLAKLINPDLNGKGTTVNVGVAVAGSQAAAVAAADPRQMVASAVRALEEQGISRDQITPDMIKTLLQAPAGVPVSQAPPPKSIEGVVLNNGSVTDPLGPGIPALPVTGVPGPAGGGGK